MAKKFKPRPYQALASDTMIRLTQGPSGAWVIVAPTGSGKTFIATDAIRRMVASGLRVAFVVHIVTIVQQTYDQLIELGLHESQVGVMMAGDRLLEGGKDRVRPDAPVQVCGVQTLANMQRRGLKLPHFDVIIIDEVHHAAAESYTALIRAYPDAWIFGLTATPQRSDGKALGHVFDELIEIVRYSELLAMEDSPIVKCEVYRPSTERLVDGLAQEPLFAWMRYAFGTKTIVYVRTIAEAEAELAKFSAAGIACGVVHSEMEQSKRELVMAAFRSGALTVLINVYVLTEGIDIPDVQTIVLARRCEHAGMYIQIAGRALRASEGKKQALIIDLTGASHRHGLPTDDREHSLDGSGIGESRPSAVAPGGDRAERAIAPWAIHGVDLVSASGAPVKLTLPNRLARLELFAYERGFSRAWVDRVTAALPALDAAMASRSPSEDATHGA